MATVTIVRSPFPGLRPFQRDEDELFFGREGQSEAIVRRLRENRFLAVVGVSGSGKSSLIRAGLIPSLDRGYMKGSGSRWRIAMFRPGSDPIGNLACELNDPGVLGTPGASEHEAKSDTALLKVTLQRSGLGLIEAVRFAHLPPEDNVLVIVDQFEELFRFADTPGVLRNQEDASAFVKLLLEATRQTELPIFVVTTMRSEFIGDCARFRDLPEAVTAGLYLIPRLTREQRRDAIVKPIELAGANITPRLINRLLNDCGDDPGQLPLLQHALMRTWRHWEAHHRYDEPIDLEDYQAIGGIANALSEHADEAYDELPDERHRQVAKRMFQCLVERGTENREVRRPTKVTGLAAVAGASEQELIDTVEYFRREGRSFLMPPPNVPLDADCVIDISHESLIRGWKQLAGWVDEEAEWAQNYRKLAERASDHAQGKAGFLRDPELSIALAWRNEAKPNAAWAKRYHSGFEQAIAFLEESRQARDAEEADRRRREKQELRRLWLFAATASVLFAVALIALLWALRERSGLTTALNRATRAERDASNKAVQLGDANVALRTNADKLKNMNAALNATQYALDQQNKRLDAENKQLAKTLREAEKAENSAAQNASSGIDAFDRLPDSVKSRSDVQFAYEKLLTAAIQAQEDNLNLNRNNREAMHYLADDWILLIGLHRTSGHEDVAKECVEKENWANNLAGDRANYFHRVLGASVLARLAIQRVLLSDKAAALRDVQKAIETADSAGDPPDRNDSSGDLSWRLKANAYYVTAAVEEYYQESDVATAHYQSALAVLERYPAGSSMDKRRHTLSDRGVKLLMEDTTRLASLHTQNNQPKLAISEYKKGIDTATDWISGHSPVSDPDLIDDFVWLYIYRGDAYVREKAYSEAENDYNSATSELRLFDFRTRQARYDAAAVYDRLGSFWRDRADQDPTNRDRDLQRALHLHNQSTDQENRLEKDAQQQHNLGLFEFHVAQDYWALNGNKADKNTLNHLRAAVEADRSAMQLEPTDSNKREFATRCTLLADLEPESSQDRLVYYGEAAAALESLTQKDAKTRSDEVSDLKQMAGLQSEAGKSEDAIKTYEKAISLLKGASAAGGPKPSADPKDTDALFWLYINKGDVERYGGQYDKARQTYSSANELAEHLNANEETGRYDRAIAVERFGNLWHDQAGSAKEPARMRDEMNRAADFHIRALERFQAIDRVTSGNKMPEAKRSVGLEADNVGLDYDALKDYTRAQQYYRESLEAYRQAALLEPGVDATYKVSRAYRRLADLDEEQENAAGVQQNCGNAIDVLRPIADSPKATTESKQQIADALGACSWLHLLTGNFPQALSYAQDGLKYDHTRNFIKLNEAHAYLALKRVDEARRIYFDNPEKPLFPDNPHSKSFREGTFADFDDIRRHPKLKADGALMANIQSIESELRKTAPAPRQQGAADQTAAPKQ